MFGSAGPGTSRPLLRGYKYTPKGVMSPGMPPPSRAPITVALVDDYDVVVKGVANMLEPYRDRLVIRALDSTMAVKDAVYIVLYDSFAQPESDHEEIGLLVANPRANRVVVYSWNFHPELVQSARQH